MKLRIVVTRTITEECEIETTPDNALAAVESLQRDDFAQTDESHKVEVFDGAEDITGDLQPYMPQLN